MYLPHIYLHLHSFRTYVSFKFLSFVSISYSLFYFYTTKIQVTKETESYLNVIFTLRWETKDAGNRGIPIFAGII